MPGQRLLMRQVREVLRLKYVCGHSGHGIAAAVGVSRYTVAEYLRRAGVVCCATINLRKRVNQGEKVF